MPSFRHKPSHRRARERFRRIVVEQLEDRSLLAATITVNSVLDTNVRDNVLTLREAILISDRALSVASLTGDEQFQVVGTPTSMDTDTIAFNIPGTGVRTISPDSALPLITDPVVIDGYTQPGTSQNTLALGDDARLLIELNGTNATQSARGLWIDAGSSTVRGLVINRFAQYGIYSPSNGGNRIEGNFIGTNALGDTALSGGISLWIDSANNTIGGTIPAARNVIVAGDAGLIYVGAFNSKATGNKIQGNYIGTNAAGTSALGNWFTIVNSSNNLIGGTDIGAGNVFGGGLNFSKTTGNVVQGNLIGTDATGTTYLGYLGIAAVDIVDSDGTIIGGDDDDDGALDGVVRARNVIVGSSNGIRIRRNSATLTGNIVQGNSIGTNADGTLALASSFSLGSGIFIQGSSNNQIGGTTQGSGNVIGHQNTGITALATVADTMGNIDAEASRNLIQGNLIGVGRDGTTPLGNSSNGITIGGDAKSNVIGGTTAGAGNVIAFNGRDGVGVRQTNIAPIANLILANSIHDNTGLGINLSSDGATPNDAGDADSGPNNLQNFPVISAATLTASTLSLNYVVSSTTTNSAYPLRVEFFKADAAGQEGKIFLGFDTYAATEAGTTKTVSFTTAALIAAGDKIVATATDNAGNTSEFSPGFALQFINSPPTITSNGGGDSASISVTENTTAFTEVDASDPDAGTTLTYSISGGADAAKFVIGLTTGVLSFVSAPNYENPTDSGKDNVYDVIVKVSDGGLSDTQTIAVTVTNVNEAPVITSNGGGTSASIIGPENATAVTDVDATDPDAGTTLTYSISSGADAAKFAIGLTTGVLVFVGAPDYEQPADAGANNVYDVVVQASDGAMSTTQTIAVTVTNVNEPPVITSSSSISVPENGIFSVLTIQATDPDAGTRLTYSISGGADAARFKLDSGNFLSFVKSPDFEHPTDVDGNNIYEVFVQVSDGALTDTRTISIAVTNQNDPPVITSNGGTDYASVNVPENTTFVTQVQAIDDDGGTTLTYSIPGGNSLFSIDSTTGLLAFVSPPDFENPIDDEHLNTYNVEVGVWDGHASGYQQITVTVTNVSESCVGTQVTNTNDAGPGSFRAAINCANDTPGLDTISFRIPGSEVHTITPLTVLPAITDPVIIDGYSQPGASPNSNGPDQPNNAVLRIELNGIATPALPGIRVTAGGSTVRGLVINRFYGHAIVLESGGGNRIEGNFIGTDPTGTSKYDFVIADAGINIQQSSDNVIGGVAIGAGNVISGNFQGINIDDGSSANVVQGNFIGTDATGTLSLGNYDLGMIIYGSSNTVGGATVAARNIISGNGHGGDIGLAVGGNGNVIEGNYIGPDRTGTFSVGKLDDGQQYTGIFAGNSIIRNNLISGNAGFGLGLREGNVVENNLIGTTASGAASLPNGRGGITIGLGGPGPSIGNNHIEQNTIAFNGGPGIEVPIAVFSPRFNQNAFLGNSIFSNSGLGIDLAGVGRTSNDVDDPDAGPNSLQNFPEITSASSEGGQLSVVYRVPAATANSAYPLHVEFFRADSNGEEGQTFLGFDTYAPFEASTPKTIHFVSAKTLINGDKIVATATDANGNTSEFSPSIAVIVLNQAPIASDDGAAVGEDGALSIVSPGLLANDTDVDLGDSKSIVGVNGLGANVGVQIVLTSGALLTVNSDGSYRYDPNGAFESLQVGESQNDYFSYTMADSKGLTSAATVTIRVDGANDAPMAGGDGFSVDEDTLLSVGVNGLVANDYDADGDELMLAVKSQPGHGQLVLRMDGSFTYMPQKDYNGPDGFTYQLSDGQATGNVATVTIAVKAVDDRPAVSLGGDLMVDEGTALSARGLFVDPDSGDAWTASVDYGDGTQQSLTLAADKTFSLGHAYRDNGSYKVTVAVQDRDLLTGTASFQVMAKNVPPQQLNWSGPVQALLGQNVVFTGIFSDPGLADTETASVDWGDSSITNAAVTGGNGTWQVRGSHAYVVGGFHSVVVTVKDDDGGAAAKSATVELVGPVLSQGALNIIGSEQRDDLKLTTVNQSLLVSGTLGVTSISQSFPLTNLQRIMVDLNAGDDSFAVDTKIKLPLLVNAGEGNDVVRAGSGMAVLIGGTGKDTLYGGSKTDLLITGATTYDENSSALAAILAEWSTSRTLATRAKNLRTGAGSVLQGTGIKLVAGKTVLNDASVDTLIGSGDTDWFMLDTKKDKVKDAIFGELYN
jgi:VCBS repeat-containing protein